MHAVSVHGAVKLLQQRKPQEPQCQIGTSPYCQCLGGVSPEVPVCECPLHAACICVGVCVCRYVFLPSGLPGRRPAGVLVTTHQGLTH